MSYTKELIQETLEYWGPKYAEKGEILTEQDAIEILDNMIGLVKILCTEDN